MKGGCKIFWTNHAISELEQTYKYLKLNFSKKELRKLSNEIEKTLNLISHNPELFPISDNKKVRKTVFLKFNSMYYQLNKNAIEVLSFFLIDKIQRNK